jgi:hypothetical protein
MLERKKRKTLSVFNSYFLAGDTPQKMTFLWKFYVIFVPERDIFAECPLRAAAHQGLALFQRV